MRAHTSMPFLLKPTTGELLRSGKTPEIDPATGEAADPADYLVWDTATTTWLFPMTLRCFCPRLKGTYEVAGQKVVPVFRATQGQSERLHHRLGRGEMRYRSGGHRGAGGEVRHRQPYHLRFGYGGSDKFSNPDIRATPW